MRNHNSRPPWKKSGPTSKPLVCQSHRNGSGAITTRTAGNSPEAVLSEAGSLQLKNGETIGMTNEEPMNRIATRISEMSTVALTKNSSAKMRSDKCPECGGTGWVVYEKDGSECYVTDERGRLVRDDDGNPIAFGDEGVKYQFARKCSLCNGGQAVAATRKTQAKIPAAFYDAKMSDFDWTVYEDDAGNKVDTTKRKQIVDTFLDRFDVWSREGIGLYIWSATRGCGKTFLASAICNTLIDRKHIRSKFVSVSDLISLEKASNEKYATDQIQTLCDAELLVLDDLGQQNNGNRWLEDILYRILEYRMQRAMVTICTSNTRIENLPFDDRITDRLEKMTQNIPLPNFRVRTRESKAQKRRMLKELGVIGNGNAKETGHQIRLDELAGRDSASKTA